ncbi:zeta toxin family protein [Candidatus Saccharibacteria bacterium]|nr:zeta toxin family protein [Candidatus Saccharibacteria bacterium]
MNSDEALAWAKQNKKQIIDQIIRTSGAEPSDAPSGIFMAGLPGAGKTELSRALIEISGTSPVRIDMDELATFIDGYEPENADQFRLAGSMLLAELFSKVLKNRLDFVMDGTFSSKNAELNIKRALKRGYKIKVVYAHQDPKLAWEFTKAREKVEHRSIEFNGFIETYYKAINNLKTISKQFDSQIKLSIAFKTPANKVGRWEENIINGQIDELIKVEYNKDKLIKYIKG